MLMHASREAEAEDAPEKEPLQGIDARESLQCPEVGSVAGEGGRVQASFSETKCRGEVTDGWSRGRILGEWRSDLRVDGPEFRAMTELREPCPKFEITGTDRRVRQSGDWTV
eukprot:Gb_27758 [translate_table: standard]